ncbi:MAG: helix-turn-helix domain-containing protein [Microbacterium sp.]
MRQWIPISTSPKGRLALAAVKEFGARDFDSVTVGELARAADVTTGAIYHHFGSKLGLYAFAREDVERRLLDRIEGAAAAQDGTAGVMRALGVGFDFAVDQNLLHLLGSPPAGFDDDRLAKTLTRLLPDAPPSIGAILAAAWRAALTEVALGRAPAEARRALSVLTLAA